VLLQLLLLLLLLVPLRSLQVKEKASFAVAIKAEAHIVVWLGACKNIHPHNMQCMHNCGLLLLLQPLLLLLLLLLPAAANKHMNPHCRLSLRLQRRTPSLAPQQFWQPGFLGVWASTCHHQQDMPSSQKELTLLPRG
jgi:hypothetical protein